jgi:hypothetical protein
VSRAWYVLCLVPAIAGGVVALRLIGRLDDQIAGMRRMVIPGNDAFVLTRGDYLVFGESETVFEGKPYTNDDFTFTTPCRLVDRQNRSLALDPITSHTAATYDRGGYRGKAMFEFTVATAGEYALLCEGDGTGHAVIAIGQGVRSQISLALLALAAGPGAGIAAFLVLYFRRRKAVQRARG